VLKKYLTILTKKNHQKVRVLTTLAIKSIISDKLYVDFSVVCECGTPCEKNIRPCGINYEQYSVK
jgi:hypothetical protein